MNFCLWKSRKTVTDWQADIAIATTLKWLNMTNIWLLEGHDHMCHVAQISLLSPYLPNHHCFWMSVFEHWCYLTRVITQHQWWVKGTLKQLSLKPKQRPKFSTRWQWYGVETGCSASAHIKLKDLWQIITNAACGLITALSSCLSLIVL